MKGVKIWLENKDRETDVQEGKISDSRLQDRIYYLHIFFSFCLRLPEFTFVLRGEL